MEAPIRDVDVTDEGEEAKYVGGNSDPHQEELTIVTGEEAFSIG
jgi:hypothetical protein